MGPESGRTPDRPLGLSEDSLMSPSDKNHEPGLSLNSVAAQSLEIGGRIAETPSGRLMNIAFKEELRHQLCLVRTIGLADIAHTLMCTEAGIIPKPEGIDLLQCLLELHHFPDQLEYAPGQGDLYTNRESWLRNKSPSFHWLGVGRARREATTTAFLITVRGLLLELQLALTDCAEHLMQRAEFYRHALMPDYTYMQPAQPTTFAHYILTCAFALRRDAVRLQELFARINMSPAGCGSSNGSRLPQDRQRLAELLGFAGLVSHARDAMWQPDLPIETISLLCTILVNLDRLAEDLQIFSTQEFALVELKDCHARASKIMPQKKNPFALTHIRSIANEMIGISTSTLAAGRTPSGQPDNRLLIYGTIPAAIEKTIGAIVLFGETISALRFDKGIGQRRLLKSDALATDLAETLILKSGLDPRTAHRFVGIVVRELHKLNAHLGDLDISQLQNMAETELGTVLNLDSNALNEALSPDQSVNSKTQPGGCASSELNSMLSEIRKFVSCARSWAVNKQLECNESERQLIANANALVKK